MGKDVKAGTKLRVLVCQLGSKGVCTQQTKQTTGRVLVVNRSCTRGGEMCLGWISKRVLG